MEINASNDLLPNINLGFKLYDSCFNEMISLMGSTWILSGKKELVPNYNCNKDIMPLAVVGDLPSKASVAIARILGLYRYPQISYASSLPILSDKIQFPSFLRTVYNGNYEPFAMGQLINFFNWTWVGIIYPDSDLGRAALQVLITQIENNGGCIAFQESLPIVNSMKAVFRIIDIIRNSKARVICVSDTIEKLVPLMEEASSQNITDILWVGSTGWSISDFPRKEMLTTLNGSLAIVLQNGKIPGFKEFLYSIHPSIYPDDIFMKTFWENAFHCVWPGKDLYNNTSSPVLNKDVAWCTGTEKLNTIDPNIYDVYNFKFTYKVHNAVFAIAHALHQMKTCVPGKGPFKNGSCADIYNHQPWQVTCCKCFPKATHYFSKITNNSYTVCVVE